MFILNVSVLVCAMFVGHFAFVCVPLFVGLLAQPSAETLPKNLSEALPKFYTLTVRLFQILVYLWYSDSL